MTPMFKIGFSDDIADRRADVLKQRPAAPSNEHRDISPCIASGMDFEILPDGRVQIEFYGEDGHTLHTQIIEQKVIHSLPVAANLVRIALACGTEKLMQWTQELGQDGLVKIAVASLYAETIKRFSKSSGAVEADCPWPKGPELGPN